MNEIMVTTQKIVKFGNSLGIILPATDLKNNNLQKGDKIRIRVERV